MPLVQKASTMSLRQRIIPRKESNLNLQQEQGNPHEESIPKWNLAQRLKRRRSTQALGERTNTNVPIDAPPIPDIPQHLQYAPLASASHSREELTVLDTTDVEATAPATAPATASWPLSAIEAPLLTAATATVDSTVIVEDQQPAIQKKRISKLPSANRESTSGGLFVKLRQSHQQLRQSFMLHDKSNSQAQSIASENASADTSFARPQTSHGKLRSVRSLGHMLSSTSSSHHSASLAPPLPFQQPAAPQSPSASPKRKQQRPNTPPDIAVDQDQMKKSFWSRMRTGFRDRKSKDTTLPLQPVAQTTHQKTPSIASGTSKDAVLSKKEQLKQSKLSRRVSNLEAQLKAARAQLQVLEAPEEESEASEDEIMHDEVHEPEAELEEPELDVQPPIYDLPFDSSDMMQDIVDASLVETDPADDLPVLGPDEISPSKAKTLSTVIEVASQECTPAQQRTEAPIMAKLKPFSLNSIGLIQGGSSGPGGLGSMLPSRPPPLRLGGGNGVDVFTSPPSRFRNRAPSLSISLPIKSAPKDAVLSVPSTQRLPAQLYFLPSSTYTEEKPVAASAPAFAFPQPTASRQIPLASDSASARARALFAAAALPSTLVQTARRPTGPIMPIMPSLSNMPARPPALRRPASMPSVASAVRASTPNLASLILQEDPREDDEDLPLEGSNRDSGMGPEGDSENDSDEDASTGAGAGIRALASATSTGKPRSVLGLLSPSDGNLRSAPTAAHRRANLRRIAAEKQAIELLKPFTSSALIRTNIKKGTVSITFPKDTPTAAILEASKAKMRPRSNSSPATARPQTTAETNTAQSPKDKADSVMPPASPALSDKENDLAEAALSRQQAQLHLPGRTALRPVIILTAADGGEPEPADGAEEEDEDEKSKKGPTCEASVADLDDPFRNHRFPPSSGGSGASIPVITTTTTTVSSISGKLDTAPGGTAKDGPTQRTEQDSRAKTLTATRTIGDRSSQLVGAQRQPEEWVWPDDVF